MHCYDQGVKLEETLRAFNDLVRSGKVRYVGLSNFTGSVLQKVMDYNHFMGFDACATLQVSSMLSFLGAQVATCNGVVRKYFLSRLDQVRSIYRPMKSEDLCK